MVKRGLVELLISMEPYQILIADWIVFLILFLGVVGIGFLMLRAGLPESVELVNAVIWIIGACWYISKRIDALAAKREPPERRDVGDT
jgi:hypothetical protein